jgi:glycine/D-amino acid oxidase-like deaminating enzyme
MTNPEIAIVGAGMAGFGATYQLSQQKLRPVIYDELTSAFSRPPSQDSSNAARYREPFLLWVLPSVVLFWLCRLWLMARTAARCWDPGPPRRRGRRSRKDALEVLKCGG